jgi:hypothetical protein
MSDDFDLDVRVVQPAAGVQPDGILTFGTTCWSCGQPTCTDIGTCGCTSGGYSSCYH